MDHLISNTADPTYDTESRADLQRGLADAEPAQIGDAITIEGNGDRVKVTVLGVIDPAELTRPGISGMMALLSGAAGSQDEAQDVRYVGVRLRMRNLEEAGETGITHGPRGGILIDSQGREYASTGDYLNEQSVPWPPARGEQPRFACDAFRIPKGATPARYVLAIGSGRRSPAGEWLLQRSTERPMGRAAEFRREAQSRLLDKGVAAWNAWRESHPEIEIQLAAVRLRDRDLRGIDLARANLERTDFCGSDLSGARLSDAHAHGALFVDARLANTDLQGCDLTRASLVRAYAASAEFSRAVMTNSTLDRLQAYGARFCGADLRRAAATEAGLMDCRFRGAQLDDADFTGAFLEGADLSGLRLHRTKLVGAYLGGADLRSATLDAVPAHGANLQSADLTDATVVDSDLSLVTLVHTRLERASIQDTRVFGVAAWDIQGTPRLQDELVITSYDQPRVTVDDLEVANFVYLMLNNDKIRNAIETVGSKGVLILGRFTERKRILEAIRHEIGRLGLLPIVFDFDRPTDRDFTETVMTLAGMSRFIVADITAPKSVPLELQATVPNYMVPFVTLLQQGEQPFSMFEDLWKKHRDWVLEPLIYESVDQLVRVFESAVVKPANERLERIRLRKAQRLVGRLAADYDDGEPPTDRS